MCSAVLLWSGGKDCYWALRTLLHQGVRIHALITTFDEATAMVPIHGVPLAAIEAQAQLLGFPLWTVALPWPCSNDVYQERLRPVWTRAVQAGCSAVAFGDLFLEDVRAFRERQFNGTGMKLLFPLWQRATAALADEMIREGMQAIVASVDASRIDPSCAGRRFDRSFLEELPQGADPCGENGEFHTFVYDGPGFSAPVRLSLLQPGGA